MPPEQPAMTPWSTMEFPVHDLIGQRGGVSDAQLLGSVHVHLVEKVGHIGLEVPDGIGIGGVEG